MMTNEQRQDVPPGSGAPARTIRTGFARAALLWLLAWGAAGGFFLLKAAPKGAGPRAAAAAPAACSDPRGPRYKRIEDVKVGDWVLARDPGDPGPPRPHRVVALPRNWTEHIVHVQVTGGGELRATRNHPFWVVAKGWATADTLTAGDRLVDDEGRQTLVQRAWTVDETVSTFNLTVEGVHTYYALAGDIPVLVHNADDPGQTYFPFYSPQPPSNTTRMGVPRDANAAWQSWQNSFDQHGYGDLLSPENRARIASGRSPVVDEAWLKGFPGSASEMGNTLEMNHLNGAPVQVPLTRSQHFEAHDRNWQNPGGPGCGG